MSDSAPTLRRKLFDCVENAGPKTTWRYSDALAIIEADRKAVALRVLDEAAALLSERCGTAGGWRASLDELAAKYKEAT